MLLFPTLLERKQLFLEVKVPFISSFLLDKILIIGIITGILGVAHQSRPGNDDFIDLDVHAKEIEK